MRDVEIVGSIFSRNQNRIQEIARKEDELKFQEKSLSSKEEALVAKESALTKRETELLAREARAVEEMKEREAALIQKETVLSEQYDQRVEALSRKEEAVGAREKDLEKRESTVSQREGKLQDLEQREAALIERETGLSKLQEELEKKESALISAVVDEKPEASSNQGLPEGEEVVAGGGEKEKRIQMIKDELQKIIQQAEEEELDGEEMEKEAVEALEKAALVVAYRKKYYDVMKDELFYFPSVGRTIISYALMEEAEKYYYDEEDEFPMSYSAALRSVVTANLGDDDDDTDEDYMAKLALDVEI